MADGNHCETIASELRNDLLCVIRIVGNLLNLIFAGEFIDFSPDDVVINYISLGENEESLPRPHIVGNPVPFASFFNRFLRQEEEWQHAPERILVSWRKQQYKSRDVSRGGKIETADAAPAAKKFQIDLLLTEIPLIHGHPGAMPFSPNAKLKPEKCIQRGWIAGRHGSLAPHFLNA